MIDSPTLHSVELLDYAPGDFIAGKYRLERRIGEGAQGSVWLAENVGLGASVAIKIVRGEPADPSPILRLEQEARAAAQIGHPAAVRVFDLGHTSGGDAYIVMEFLEGENLADRLAEYGRMSAVEAVRTLLPIADVLHVAHAHGIVHRDLKPANIFLTASGVSIQPKLLDFGVAKQRRGTGRSGKVITQVGMLIGSPAYLSPEQAICREDVGPAADIWSFCVVLYECITGTLPFDSTDCRELFRRIGESAPDPILAHGVGDFELWEILRRGLEKAPEERWPSIEALGRALAAWLGARGIRDDVAGVVLESKWRGRERTLTAFEPSDSASFVRRVALGPTDPLSDRREPPKKRRAALTLVAGGIALGIVLAAGYSLVERFSTAATLQDDATLAPAVVIESPRLVPETIAARVAEHPRAEAPEPPPTVSARPPALTRPLAPAPPKRRDRERTSDLLNPY